MSAVLGETVDPAAGAEAIGECLSACSSAPGLILEVRLAIFDANPMSLRAGHRRRGRGHPACCDKCKKGQKARFAHFFPPFGNTHLEHTRDIKFDNYRKWEGQVVGLVVSA